MPALSRRALLLSAGLALLPAIPLARPAAAAQSGGDTIPDPVGVSGSWTRTADAGFRVVTGTDANAIAVSEQQLGANAVLTASVTTETPYAVAALAFRTAPDGSAGYAASLDPNLSRIRLFDLATGADLTAPVPFTAAPGTPYRLEAALDGPAIRIAVDGTTVLTAQDSRYATGSAALHAYNGTVAFGPPTVRAVTTNLTGWTTTSGSWTATPTGWRADAPATTNSRAISATSAYDTDLRADLLIRDPYAVAALLVRTDATGSSGYAVEADPNQDRLRLYRIEDDLTLGTYTTPVEPGRAYRLRIAAEGDRLRVHWQTDYIRPDGYAPVITAQDAAHASGRFGLLAYNGTASFEEVTAADLVTDLADWTTRSGGWTPDLRGIRAAGPALRTAPFASRDLFLSTDLTLAAGTPSAGLVLHANADGTGGVEARLDAVANALLLLDRATGAELARWTPTARPIRAATPYRLELHADGGTLTMLLDGVQAPAAVLPASGGSTVGLTAGGLAWFQSLRAREPARYRTEPWRPAYHYSQLAGYASDPNGLVFHDGEYHLFHQDEGRWAHAVSTDLVHWRALPIALPFNEFGQCWSGSAVVDEQDLTGLFGGGAGLLAYYTGYQPDLPAGHQCVRLAYSTDRGRSWQCYGTAPVVDNPGGPTGGWDFRDPKVVRDVANDRWVMVVSGGDHVRFHVSTDLLHWTYTGSFGYGSWLTGGVWECPDLFPLPVDGDPARVRWVLTFSTGAVRSTDGSAAQYVVGSWDGATFTAETPAGMVLRADSGRDHYAAMSFAGLPGGRRVWIGWMSNWDYAFSAPTGGWRGQLGVPRELTLTETAEGLRLRQLPVSELAVLRSGTVTRQDVLLGPGSANPLDGVRGFACEIEAEFALPTAGAATELGFRVRAGGAQRTLVGYDVVAARLFVDRTAAGRSDFTQYFAGRTVAPLATTVVGGERRVTLRILVDASSVEAFGGDGAAAITSLIYPDADAQDLSCYVVGGTARIVSLAVHQLAGPRTVPPAVNAPAGGEFRTDLGALAVLPGGRWETTGAGRAGSFDRDSFAVSDRQFTDLDLTTVVRLGGPDGQGGAASIMVRASADCAQGYVVNLDPDLRTVRLFRKVGGTFDDATALAKYPVLVRRGAGYPVRVLVQGARIQVFLCGERVVDVTDGTFGAGRVALNVFGGRAAYQDTYATAL